MSRQVPWPRTTAVGVVIAGAVLLAFGAARDARAQSEARRISATWSGAPINDVLLAFAAFSGRSIVVGSNVTGSVTADINGQPWDVAMRTILAAQGLIAIEDEYGIIRVGDIEALHSREATEPILTRVYHLSFTPASELQVTLTPLLSERGRIAVGRSTNTLVVTDIARVQNVIAGLLR